MADFPKRAVMRAHCVAAAAVALAYAATRARIMAERDEREIQRLMSSIVELQMRKVEAKTEWLEGGCWAEDEEEEKEDEGKEGKEAEQQEGAGGGAAKGGAAAAAAGGAAGAAGGGGSLHASIVADTRYLVRERERLEKEAAKLLHHQAPTTGATSGGPGA